MNLTVEFPRSPRATLGGLVHLPRMTDKARAKKEGTLGEYIYPCPLDEMLLEFLNIGEDEFLTQAVSLDDAQLEEWVQTLTATKCQDDIPNFNMDFLDSRPDNEESQARFKEILNSIDPSRTDVTTWPGLIDLEEGH